MFEYKFVPTPKQVRRGGETLNGPDALTRTLDSEIKMILGTGWDFVRTERLPVKGTWFFLPVTRQQDFMVFRRPVAEAERPVVPQPVAALADVGVRPRRVQARGHATSRPGGALA